jgi:hypothetical protein
MVLGLFMATLPVAVPVAHHAATNTAALSSPPVDALPLAFVPNVGQTDPAVRMETRSPEGTVSFLAHAVVFTLPHATTPVRLQFGGAYAATIRGADRLPGTVNDLRGDDPAQWHTGIPTYAGVVYQDLYAGIDLRYDGMNGRLKGTYTVAPGSDPAQIRWHYSSTQDVAVDQASGDLRITVAADQTMTEAAPVAWQDIAGQRVPVDARYQVTADDTISFAVGAYNAAYPLVIDPTIAWSTYLGGRDVDQFSSVAVDTAGNVYVTGNSFSVDFPTATALQPTNPGDGSPCFRSVPGPCQDVVITKLSGDGHTLLYSTYLGGISNDVGTAIAVDAAGNAYVAGITTSTDFPKHQPWQAQCAVDGAGECQDGFVAKLNADGTALRYSTYLGGTDFDNPGGIAVDQAGEVVVAGSTASTDFPRHQPLPGTPGGINAFVTKFTAGGQSLVFSTVVGGSGGDSGLDVAVNGAGQIFLTGVTSSTNFPTRNAMQPKCAVDPQGTCVDAFVTTLTADGQSLVYSTYLGGSDIDVARGLALDGAGRVVLVGATASPNFPLHAAMQAVKRGQFDAFVTKLTPTGSTLVYSTYLGGSGVDEANAVIVDRVGNTYLVGETSSANFPIVNAVQPTPGGGDCTDGGEQVTCPDGFVTKVAVDGATLSYATYLGGKARVEFGELGIAEAARDIAVDRLGNAYVVGTTTALDFPTRHAFQPPCAVADDGTCQDGFVTKIGSTTVQLFVPVVRK